MCMSKVEYKKICAICGLNGDNNMQCTVLQLYTVCVQLLEVKSDTVRRSILVFYAYSCLQSATVYLLLQPGSPSLTFTCFGKIKPNLQVREGDLND